MNTKLMILCLLTLVAVACTQKGTEVLNPQETVTMKSSHGQFSLGIMPGWSYIICSENQAGCASAYQDPLGSAEVLLVLTKGQSNFVLLADTLTSGQTLTGYVNARSQTADEKDSTTEGGIEMMLVNQDARSANDGSVSFIYATDGNLIAVIRIDIVASTVEEAQTTADEFMAMGRSVTME